MDTFTRLEMIEFKNSPYLDIDEWLYSLVNEVKSVKLKDIIVQSILNNTRLTFEELKCKSNKSIYTFPRHMLYYFLYNYDTEDLIEISKTVNKDHSSVVHGLHVITNYLGYNNSSKDTFIRINSFIVKTLIQNGFNISEIHKTVQDRRTTKNKPVNRFLTAKTLPLNFIIDESTEEMDFNQAGEVYIVGHG